MNDMPHKMYLSPFKICSTMHSHADLSTISFKPKSYEDENSICDKWRQQFYRPISVISFTA
jgi:hypothetical protein